MCCLNTDRHNAHALYIMKSAVLVLPAWSNRVRDLADVSTRCSSLLQGESGSQYEGYPFIYSRTQVITGCHRKPRFAAEVAVWSPVDRALTALQCSHPALRNSLPPVSVDAFSSRGALDVDGLFQQKFLRSPGPVDHRVLPVDGMVAPQACSATTDFCRDWVRHPDVTLALFPASAWSCRCGLCHSCRESGTLRWPAYPPAEHPSLWSALVGEKLSPFNCSVTMQGSARFLTLLLQSSNTRTVDFISKPAEKLSLHYSLCIIPQLHLVYIV